VPKFNTIYTSHIGPNKSLHPFYKGFLASESFGIQCATAVGIDKEPPRAYISKNGRIVAFDFFAPYFPQELLSYCSLHGTIISTCKHGGEVFFCTILESSVP
jgi:hypothetical protein